VHVAITTTELASIPVATVAASVVGLNNLLSLLSLFIVFSGLPRLDQFGKVASLHSERPFVSAGPTMTVNEKK